MRSGRWPVLRKSRKTTCAVSSTRRTVIRLSGCFDDQPFGYFELYWAAEDRIGRHYRWQPFDRGLHMLVGEENWRGAQYIPLAGCGLEPLSVAG